LRSPASGGTENGDAVADDVLHLAFVPVPGVGEHDVGVVEPDRVQFAPGGADHRLEVSEVR
jgi:hypothetical protein